MDEEINLKLVVLGDGQSGKTQLLIRFSSDKFPSGIIPTVFDNYAITLTFEGKRINLGLWDTAGAEEYNRLRPLAYPHCDVFIIAFSIFDIGSFNNACKKFYVELKESTNDVPILFVGNKNDHMKEESHEKMVKNEDAKKAIEDELGCKYMECNSLTGEGTHKVLEETIRMALKRKKMPLIKKKKQNYCSLI